MSAPDPDAERLARGRALKQRAYAAMYTDLAEADAATAQIAALAAQAHRAAVRSELQALADWVAGAVLALKGQPAAAIARLDAAARAFEPLAQLHSVAACQVPKIASLAMLGRHGDALVCAQRTLAQLDALGDEAAAGKVEINLGSMLLRQDRYAEAAAHYRRAAVRFARVGDRRHSVMADIGLAGALSWQYQFDEALRIYERADARAQAHGLDHLQGVIHSSRGLLELRRGRHAEALRWLESALREAEAHGPPQRLADARAEVADAYLALNLLPEAKALYESAIDGCRANDAPIEQSWACAQLALVQARLGANDAALTSFTQARALFEAQGNDVGAAWLDLQSAALLLARGDADRAQAQAAAAAAVLGDAGMRGWALEARVLGAEAQAAAGDAAGAKQRLHALLDDTTGLPELQARCLVALGRLRQSDGDRAGAHAHYEAAAAAIESQQAALHDDEFRTAYSADKQAAFDALIGLALDDGDPPRLLAAMERARARALRIGLQRAGATEEPAFAADWREPLHWLQQQWQQAVAAGERERAAALQARARALEDEALQAHRRARGAAGAAAEALSPAAAFDVQQLQQQLTPQRALVAYAWSGHRLAVVVVRRDTLHQTELGAEGVAERVGQLRFQLDSLRYGGERLRRAHGPQLEARAQAHLRRLHDQLWAPIAGWLEGAEEVTVLPQRGLHYLPFCALHDGDAALLDRHAITLAPSAALWSAATPLPPTAAPRAVVIGHGGDALPHVSAEVEAVAAALPGATTLLGPRATLQGLRDAVAAGIDVLHLACHGQFRADSPYFSSLALADGGLTLRDAAALPLAGSLVALSACETGLSRVAPGDELVGLVRGFLLAGASAVMATLWTVDDAGTAALMADFYRRTGAGEAPAQALRAAQQALRNVQPHPFYWAPFAQHGRV